MTLASFTIPGLKLVSEANAHEHWRMRQRRAKAQRGSAGMHALQAGFQWARDAESIVVRIYRIAPRELDSDNLVGSAKHVRDGIADALGINDRNKRITWFVLAEKGRPKEYGVRVEIEAVHADEKSCAEWDRVLP